MKQLTDQDFALVYTEHGQKIRKYPINNEKNAMETLKRFPVWVRNLTPPQKIAAAEKLAHAINRFGIKLDTEELIKAGSELICHIIRNRIDLNKLAFEVDKRKELISTIYGSQSNVYKTAKEAYDAFYNVVSSSTSIDPVKTVDTLYTLDKSFKIASDIFYGRKLQSPEKAIFSDQIITNDKILYQVNDKVITAEKLYKMASHRKIVEQIKNIFGAKFGNKFRNDPIATFQDADVTYRGILMSIAEKADI